MVIHVPNRKRNERPETLAAAYERFGWAVHHADSASHEVFKVFKPSGYATWDDELKHGGQMHEYVLTHLAEIPDRLSLVVADSLHNFRACLDNLVYSLALVNNCGNLNSRKSRECTFPIGKTVAEYTDQVSKGATRHIPADAQTFIETLQPYHAGKDAEQHPLNVLRSLSDWDKHRAIPLTFWALTPRGFNVNIPGMKIIMEKEPLELGTKFMTVKVPPAYSDVDVHPTLQLYVSIKEPEFLWGVNVMTTLWHIQNFISESVLKPMALAGFFPDADDGLLTVVTGIVHPYSVRSPTEGAT